MRAAFAGRFGGVLQQIGQNALDQILIGQRLGRAFIEPAFVGHFGMRRLEERDRAPAAAH